MIVRVWKGQTTVKNADAYKQYLANALFPSLARIPGHRGAQILRRETATGAEFVIVTYWDSMVTYAGGYARKVEDTVTIHCNTVLAAKEIFGTKS